MSCHPSSIDVLTAEKARDPSPKGNKDALTTGLILEYIFQTVIQIKIFNLL
jgi:hypothetical protein